MHDFTIDILLSEYFEKRTKKKICCHFSHISRRKRWQIVHKNIVRTRARLWLVMLSLCRESGPISSIGGCMHHSIYFTSCVSRVCVSIALSLSLKIFRRNDSNVVAPIHTGRGGETQRQHHEPMCPRHQSLQLHSMAWCFGSGHEDGDGDGSGRGSRKENRRAFLCINILFEWENWKQITYRMPAYMADYYLLLLHRLLYFAYITDIILYCRVWARFLHTTHQIANGNVSYSFRSYIKVAWT